ncbi:MAG: putative primase [Prokaryotic dsDNA virus sp.]|nr:hypothetical protein [Aequorivita sp.]QDP57293.1 MAG: putative primase [Prokaryotic dsDNA virus sp.]|tara:strand:+ start:17841 stop:19925 length:2085 start_codon:yes stop_codon:yes gene_type:complete
MEDLKAIRVIPGMKVSHDYMGNNVSTFGYRHLIEIGVPVIGIPGRQNNLVIVDVDAAGESHKHDGRAWWDAYCKEAGIPKTYSVSTPSGGAHYYFRLPVAINPETFSPPATLADGVDIKWNGWVAAPPSKGYMPMYGGPGDILDAPPSLIAEMEVRKAGQPAKGLNNDDPFNAIQNLARPYTEGQIEEIRKRIDWLQSTGSLSRDEWRDGIFSLKAGIQDPEILDEFLVKWSMNKNYTPGDENIARDMAERADEHGAVGPGTIFSILKNVALREGAPIVASPYTRQEIIDKSKVKITVTKDGVVKVAPTESNVASLMGAMFDSEHLFHDIRNDNFVYKGQVYSDTDLANIFSPMIQSPSYGLGFENMKRSTVAGGIDVLMAARQIDPHRRWLDGLEWDGVKRIDTFFSVYASVKNSSYVQAVSKNMWIAMAARGLQPGAKFDNVIVLEGPEGARKSTLCELLGGEYYMSLSSKEDINSPDVLRKMHQSSIVELPELVGLLGRSGEEIKAILATRIDSMRALYSKKGVRKARGFIFIATTNSKRYINEDMGYRRYWPIKIPGGVCQIDTDAIKRDRDMLFAEAVARFNTGEEFWDVPKELRGEVELRRNEEPLTEPVREIMENALAPVRMTDIYKHLEAGGYVSKGLTYQVSARINIALKTIGAEEVVINKARKWIIPTEQIVEVQPIVGASSFI